MRAWVQARWETRLLLRNGEQVLLTVLIPLALLLGLTLLDIWPVRDDKVATAVAAVWTVSVLATCFTSLAIATGFERRSGALRYLATTPLTRMELLFGKTLATGFVTALSVILVGLVALALGWRPTWWVLPSLGLMCVAGCAFATWAFVLAGTLRAEAVLAVANAIFLGLLFLGGIVVPVDRLPPVLSNIAGLLPTGALSEGLTTMLVDGSHPGIWPVAIELAWLVCGLAIARRTFRWS